MSLDLAPALREAIIGNIAITALLSTWEGEPAVFTRRPTPADAIYPLIQISPDISVVDRDMLVEQIPVIRRDIAVYGDQGPVPDVGQYRIVEQIAYLLRKQFHRKRLSISASGYNVIDIVAHGPMTAPVDDEKLVGRAVLLTIRAQDLAT